MPKVDCPNCSARLDVPPEYDGRTAKCVRCGKAFQISLATRKPSIDPDDFEPAPPPMMPPQHTRPAVFAPGAPPPTIPTLTQVGAGIISAFGLIAFVVSAGFFITALQMDTTVESHGLDRIHNQGLMHERQTRVLASGTVMLIAVLTLGFNSVRMASARTDLAIKELAAALRA
jgi:hypothetical protein